MLKLCCVPAVTKCAYNTMVYKILLYSLLFFVDADLKTRAESVSVNVTVNTNGCSPKNLIVLADQPLQMRLFRKNLYPSYARCVNNNISLWALNNDILTFNNVSSAMGRTWKCTFEFASREYACTFEVRYRNRNEAVVLVDTDEVKTVQTSLDSVYDGYLYYYYKKEDFRAVVITCRSKYQSHESYCHKEILLINSKGVTTGQYFPGPNTCTDVRITFELNDSADDTKMLCSASGYMSIINFKMMNSTINYDDPETSPVVVAAVVCGAISIVVLVGYFVSKYLKRLIIKNKKDRVAAGTYDNFPRSSDSPPPYPNPWIESNDALPTNSQQSESNCGPQSQDNIDMLYARPIPKKGRRNNIIVSEEFEEVGRPSNEAGDGNNELNYAQIVFNKDPSMKKIEARGDDTTYSEVLPWNDPSKDNKYDNVFENGRYVNAHDTTEYVEPAYCDIRMNKNKK